MSTIFHKPSVKVNEKCHKFIFHSASTIQQRRYLSMFKLSISDIIQFINNSVDNIDWAKGFSSKPAEFWMEKETIINYGFVSFSNQFRNFVMNIKLRLKSMPAPLSYLRFINTDIIYCPVGIVATNVTVCPKDQGQINFIQKFPVARREEILFPLLMESFDVISVNSRQSYYFLIAPSAIDNI